MCISVSTTLVFAHFKHAGNGTMLLHGSLISCPTKHPRSDVAGSARKRWNLQNTCKTLLLVVFLSKIQAYNNFELEFGCEIMLKK